MVTEVTTQATPEIKVCDDLVQEGSGPASYSTRENQLSRGVAKAISEEGFPVNSSGDGGERKGTAVNLQTFGFLGIDSQKRKISGNCFFASAEKKGFRNEFWNLGANYPVWQE
ncbi:hypothetical protein U1Q18_039933 [Sarracenia purpurea var. burkii]